MVIIIYNHYLQKNSKLKYQVLKSKLFGNLLLNPIKEYNSSKDVKSKIIACVLINCGKCKMQIMNYGINVIKMYGSIHVLC